MRGPTPLIFPTPIQPYKCRRTIWQVCESRDPGASGQVQASKGGNGDQQAQGLLLLLLLLLRLRRVSSSLLADDADVSCQMLQAAALVIEVREP